MASDLVARKLIAWKDALIDLTRRNPLLSLPTRSVVALKDDPDSLWKLPVQGSKRLCFVPEKIPGTDVLRTLKAGERAVDAASFRTLNNLRLKARLSLNEQGVNSLFIAIGVLEWSDPSLGAPVRSPLLLLPVTLERTPEGDGILLGRFEEEPRLNPTLLFRLSKPDVHFEFPETEEGFDEEFLPSAYLETLATRVAARSGWRVMADECLLGRFSFLNLVMYEELDQRLEVLKQHPIIAAIAGDTQQAIELRAREDATCPEIPESDTEPPQMAFHVLPADPSQEKAILAARYNRSLVIQGPPGTGKTQTITNLIATCIADGKKVLFVSEKMAALEAVYKRLDALGLADLCLEAHSHKASKQEVLAQLRRALEEKIRVSKVNPAELSVMTTLRDGFRQSVEALHRDRDPLGISVYEARGRVAALAGIPDFFFALDRVEETDNDLFHHQEQLTARLASFHDLFEKAESHPWLGIKADRYSQGLHSRVRDVVNDLLKVTDALEDSSERLWELLNLPAQAPDFFAASHTDWLVEVALQLQQSSRPPSGWLTGTEEYLVRLRQLAVSARKRFRAFAEQQKALFDICHPAVLELSHDELLHALTTGSEPALAPGFGSGWADVPTEAFSTAKEVCGVAELSIPRFLQSAERLAQQCGLTVPLTLAQCKAALEVVRLALTDPRPLPHWLTGNSHDALVRTLEEAKKLHREHRLVSAQVAETYSESIYSLDLAGIRSRFLNEYASWTRVFKSAYRQDRRALTGVLQAEQSLKGRNLPDDLRLASQVQALEGQIRDREPGFKESFGSRYQCERSDWNELQKALDDTHAIVESLGGTVPEKLGSLLQRSGSGISELREQYDLTTQLLHEAEKSLAEVATCFRIPGADTRPLSQLPLDPLKAELQRIRETIATFTAARQRVREVHLSPSTTTGRLCASLQEAHELVRQSGEIAQESQQLEADYGHHFQGLETDWETVLRALDDAERLRSHFADRKLNLTPIVLAAMSGENLDAVAQATQQSAMIRPLLRELDRVSLELLTLFDPITFSSYSAQREWAEVRLGALSQLERWLSFQAVRSDCERYGLLSFSEVITRRRPPAEQIPSIFARAFYQRWLDAIVARTPELHMLSASEYAPRAASFTQLDRRLIAMNANRVKANARERRELVQTKAARTGEVGFLQKILNQRRPRAPIRKILAEIPNLLFRMKPCLMMSPLSVSLFLDPDRVRFDVVIFDEASQIFPEYALGPLLRADQAVIAGDSKQLPPTSFFKSMQETEDDEDDEVAQAGDAREYGSILEAAAAVFSPDREFYLTWHYRSKHESLIDFSRRHFYESKLATFPSAHQTTAISFEHVPNAVYYGGKGKPRNNPVEAARVADLVEDYVRKNPTRSVGVITMSEAQRDCVRAAIEERTQLDGTLAALLNEDKPDGFFVKNIENVQGDERDAIFLSIGYGKWEDGRARMLFGPINRDGGKRRLNVAVTRAREHMTVVSSLLPEEIRLADTASEGAQLLQAYLSYARTSALSNPAPPSTCDDSFVEAVAVALEARNYIVQRQVGLSDYHVDLAICDPENPERYLLGIECDGENYTIGETIRAREWLRSEVLKSLGWRLYRLWSADWVRDPAKALEAIESAIANSDTPESVPTDFTLVEATPEPSEAATPSEEPVAENGLLPGLSYFMPADDLVLPGGTDTLYGEYQDNALDRAEFVRLLVQREGPIPSSAIAYRLCRAAGLSRTGGQIRRITEEAIELLSHARQIECRGDFVWQEGMDVPPARIPAPGSEPRPIENISPEELAQVIYIVLQNGIGMRLEELVRETSRVLGFGATGAALRERIEAAIGHMEIDHRIHNFNGQLRTFESK